MEKKWKVVLSLAVVIGLVIGLYYISKTITVITGKGIAGWVSRLFE